jgi:hypothetical protein
MDDFLHGRLRYGLRYVFVRTPIAVDDPFHTLLKTILFLNEKPLRTSIDQTQKNKENSPFPDVAPETVVSHNVKFF